MKTIKILDIYDHTEDNVDFGTCELCFSTGSLTTEFIKVEYDSKVYDLELGGWSWGDYIPYMVPNIDNIVKFNDFLITQPVDIKLNKYDSDDNILTTLTDIMEYYDKFHQRNKVDNWAELLVSRLQEFTKKGLISMSNFKPQEKLETIVDFLQHHEYYALNSFIDIYVCPEYEYDMDIPVSESDQKWSFIEMCNYINVYNKLVGDGNE